MENSRSSIRFGSPRKVPAAEDDGEEAGKHAVHSRGSETLTVVDAW